MPRTGQGWPKGRRRKTSLWAISMGFDAEEHVVRNVECTRRSRAFSLPRDRTCKRHRMWRLQFEFLRVSQKGIQSDFRGCVCTNEQKTETDTYRHHTHKPRREATGYWGRQCPCRPTCNRLRQLSVRQQRRCVCGLFGDAGISILRSNTRFRSKQLIGHIPDMLSTHTQNKCRPESWK